MKICLAIAPFFHLERLHPPLGLGYLAAIARRDGHECRVFDFRMRFENAVSAEDRKLLGAYDHVYFKPVLPPPLVELVLPQVLEWAEEIARDKPDVLGLSCFRSTRICSLAIAIAIKKISPQTFVVFGGPDCTLNAEAILGSPAVDAVISGDGEEPFAALLSVLANGGELSSVPHLLWRENGEIQKSTATSVLGLDDLPVPDFTGLSLQQYWASRPDKPPMLPVVWQRGCTANCTFCNERAFWPQTRVRPPESIVAEMKAHRDRYGVDLFEFYDLSINNYPRKLADLCKLLRGQDLRWFGMARFTRSLTNELIDAMAESGCIHLSLGLESGSSSVLHHMGKYSDTRDISRILQRMTDAGIETHCMVIVGYPTETEDDFQDTIRFLDKNQRFITSVNLGSTCSIKPGTPLWGMTTELDIRFDDHDAWHRGDNTPAERLARLERLKDAVTSMSFQRSQKYDVLTEYNKEKMLRPLSAPPTAHYPATKVIS